MKIALGIEYEGTAFCGWQIQPRQNTIQGCLEQALHTITGETATIVAAGRTDAGVHALQQVVHFETRHHRHERNWVLGLNSHLPAGINVNWAREVTDDFHARFSAKKRHYRYLILNRMSRSALFQHRMWWLYNELDIERMQRAADLLIGKHDFSAFRARECQARSPVKTLQSIRIVRQENCIAIDVSARSFLHHMVRNLVGVLVPIGDGRKPVEWAAHVLESRQRSQGGVTAPPQGLYFVRVDYPDRYALPVMTGFPVVW